MDYARYLTEGLGGWLQFEAACDRSGLFSEKYLSYPVGQILSAWAKSRPLAEYRHPSLNAVPTPGRPAEIDFAVCEHYPKVSVAVELKWIGNTRISVKSAIWDLIRLALIARHEKARCFFVLGGKRTDLDRLFGMKNFMGRTEGFSSPPLLSIENNVLHKTQLTASDRLRIPLLRSIYKDYQDFEFPNYLHSRRSQPFPANPIANRCQVYAWEVTCGSNVPVFKPRNSQQLMQSSGL